MEEMLGRLYEMEFADEEPKLTPQNYVQYLTSFGFPEPEEFVIDIIKIDFLGKYLDMLEKEAEQLVKKVASFQSPSNPPT